MTLKMRREEWKRTLILVYCGAMLLLPLLVFGFPFPSHDGEIHARWHTYFSEQLFSGQLYPRWLLSLNEGFGSPAFYFYPPVPYWVASVFGWCHSSPSGSWNELAYAAALGLIASGFTMYLWLKRITTPWPASLAAIIYMALPYHLAVDLWIRGAYAEFWAFVWMPLSLYWTMRLLAADTIAFLGLALVYALLIMTHLPTTLIFSVIPLAHAALAPAKVRWMTFGQIAGAMCLGIGLAGMYLSPALLCQDAVSMEFMRTGPFYYANGFFFPHWGAQIARDEFERDLFWTVLSMVVIGACAMTLVRLNRHRDVIGWRLAIFWSICGVSCVVMMFPISEPLWHAIPKLPVVQFPWRFNVLLCVAVTALLAIALKQAWKTKTGLVLGVIIFIAVLGWWPVTNKGFHNFLNTYEPWGPEATARFLSEGPDVPEYRPRQARSVTLGAVWSKFKLKNDRDGSSFVIIDGAGSANVARWESRSLRIHTSSDTGMVLLLHQFYFPGWRATIAQSRREIPLHPSDQGALELHVPAGNHAIDVILGMTLPERLGYAATAMSVIIWIALWLFWRLRKAKILH